MESFYRTHKYLLKHLPEQLVRRGLMDEIDWTERMIGIKGSRGIGKTTFLLSLAKELYGINNRKCLYINLNQFLFTERTLVDFTADFFTQGGRTLLIDQVFKYPDWSRELRICYDRFPELKIIFTGSSVMRLKEENHDLSGKVAVYYLRGFSFREYLNLTIGENFPAYKLQDIILNHNKIAHKVNKLTNSNLQAYFKDYLHHGFYPFFLEKRNYSENLLKKMNMTLEVDVLYIKQIEQRYLPKLRKLLYQISLEAPFTPNISRFSKELDMSRATVMNYIKYLKDARLINLLYDVGEDFPKKPSMIYLYNTNLLHVMNQEHQSELTEYKTFFFNQLQKDSIVTKGDKNTDFTIDGEHGYCIRDNISFSEQGYCISDNISFKNIPPYYYVVNTDIGSDNCIPIWLFGFLY